MLWAFGDSLANWCQTVCQYLTHNDSILYRTAGDLEVNNKTKQILAKELCPRGLENLGKCNNLFLGIPVELPSQSSL